MADDAASVAPTHWSEIDPKDAADITLPWNGIEGPLNEIGERCPWPWHSQQLVGAPMGQYHCPYCGGMVIAGMAHFDWDDFDVAADLAKSYGAGDSDVDL